MSEDGNYTHYEIQYQGFICDDFLPEDYLWYPTAEEARDKASKQDGIRNYRIVKVTRQVVEYGEEKP